MHVYNHADLSVEEGVTPLLPRQVTLTHVARVEPRLNSPRQLTLMCTAERIALFAALATADTYGQESIALDHVSPTPMPPAKRVLPCSCHFSVPPDP